MDLIDTPPEAGRPPVRRHRTRRRRLLALVLTATTVAGTGVAATATPSQALGVGVGVPLQFNLTDNQGSWYDTGLNLFGTKSLGVTVLPRSGLEEVPLDVTGLLNNTTSSLLNLPIVNGLAPSLNSLTGGASGLLNLDSLTQQVDASGGLLGFLNPTVQRAKSDITQLTQQLGGASASEPISLNSLPVGVDLMATLQQLAASNPADISLIPKSHFTIAAPAAASSHTVTSLIWPDGATPIDQTSAFVGDTTANLTVPGLYAWACKIHPYMLGAVVVDDPLTPGLDFGKKLHLNIRGGNMVVPSSADVVSELVQKFFRITSPGNWQHFSATQPTQWNPTYPPAPILMYDGSGNPVLVPSLDAYFNDKFNEGVTLPAANTKPAVPGVGEVWVDTQMEKTAGKVKSGSATKVDVQNWTVARTVSMPQINMNNPHNMWSDREGKWIYQTEWFSDRLTVFDRKTGELVRTIQVGPDPSHVMTRSDTDQLHVAINAGNAVVELSPGATKIDRRIMVQFPGEKPAHPHAHWMSADGHTMVTPNVNNNDETIVDVPSGTIRKQVTEELPIATSITPDGKKSYVANFLGQSVSCTSLTSTPACHNDDGSALVDHKNIDLWKTYDPISGSSSGTFGGLPIQIPTSPDGNYVLVANTLTNNITVIDTHTDKVVKYLPCDSGCHGINFGAKQGGGYYAYVSSKFANTLSIIDGDPNGDGNPADAAVVGKMILDQQPGTARDDTVTDYNGMGGQGVFAYPNVYNGWVQNSTADQAAGLTCNQLNPINPENCQ